MGIPFREKRLELFPQVMLFGSFFSSPFNPNTGLGVNSSAAANPAQQSPFANVAGLGAQQPPSSPFGASSPVFPSGMAGGFPMAGNTGTGSLAQGLQQQQSGGDPLAQMGMQSMTPDTQMLFATLTTMMAGLMTMIASLLTGILNGSISGKAPAGAAPGGTMPGGLPGSTDPGAQGSGGTGKDKGKNKSGGTGDTGATGGPTDPQSVGKGGNVDQWVDQAVEILKSKGVPESKMDKAAIKKIIQRESGGNPKAVNNWDSNAKAGHPSKGILQTIDSTFNSYKVKGYDDIFNPVHNIMAAVKYMIDRYGSASAVAARSGGY